MPIAEYFVMPEGAIPEFDADLLHPFKRGDGKRYDGAHVATGTIIKLYDYQVGSKFLSFEGSREALNENLVETILPFRLLDFRQKPDASRGGDRAQGIDPRPFYGMEFLLLRSHKENDQQDDEDDAAGEARISVGKIDDPELGEISISAIKLKRTLPSWLGSTNNRVFHAVNGQVQLKQTRGYLTSCGFPALKDRVVVVVDASNLTFAAHNDVWKGDREHIRQTIVGERYAELVSAAIRDSKALEDMQRQVAAEEMQRAAKSERNDLFQKLVDADRNLAALLTDRDPVIYLPAAGGEGGGDKGEGTFKGKYSPTFLRIEEKSKTIEIPLNRRRPVVARTDAANDFLDRPDNRGRLVVPPEISRRFTIAHQLHNGRLVVYFQAIEGQCRPGQKFSGALGLQDPAMPAPVEDDLTFSVVEDETPSPRPKPRPKPGPDDKDKKGDGGDKKKGEGRDAPTHGLPRYILLTQDGRKVGEQESERWINGFGEHDGGTIRDFGADGVIYLINYDNAYHLRYRQQQRGDLARDVVTEKYILGMRILMMGYEHALRSMSAGQSNGMSEYFDEFRRMAARGSASTVLALAENLPRIVDSTSVSRDVE
jgi:hypothetical protein